MKLAIYPLTVLMLTMGTCAVSHAQGTIGPVGKIHKIDIRAVHPRAYHPDIGDVVQCYIDFTVVPGQIIDNLKLATEGKSIAIVGVVKTTPENTVGSDQISVFLIPRQEGLTKLKVQPVIANAPPKSYEMRFLISLPGTN